jgi:hypothetical protein
MLSIDSVVNTDLNCSFKMFAFCLVSATSCPSFFKGATPLLSVLSDFMKKSFFGFLGLSDHDVVYTEADIWLRKVRQQPRKILRYDKANWDNIKSDLEDTRINFSI